MSWNELMKIYSTVAGVGAAELVRNHSEVTTDHAAGILRRSVADREELEQLSEQAWHNIHKGKGRDFVEQAEEMADGPLEQGLIQLKLWSAAAMHRQPISYEDLYDHHHLIADSLEPFEANPS